jgi:hypothetical protein
MRMNANFLKRFSSPSVLAAIICVGAIAMFSILCIPLATGRVYVEDDLSAFNLPMRHFYQQCLVNGDSPVWMPKMFCGFDAHGEGQAGMFHPEHYFLYRFLPLGVAFNLEMLLNYPMIFLGACIFLRRWRIPLFACLFSAALFTFSGFCMTNYIHIMMPSVIAYMPWLLILIDVAMRTDNRRTMAACSCGVAFLTGLQFFLGFPQCVYLSSLIEGLYVLFLLAVEKRNYFAVFALGAAKAFSFLIGAAQILPQVDAAYHSIRLAPAFTFLMGGSMHPANLLQFVSPYLFNRHGWTNDLSQYWDPPYFGAVAPLLIIWSVCFLFKRRETRKLIIGCLLLAALGIILALGEYGYIYRFFVHIPLLGKFRNPSRHMLMFHLAAAILIALAFADLAERNSRGEKTPWRRLWPLASPVLLSAGIVVGLIWLRANANTPFLISAEKHFAPTSNAIIGAALLVCATILVLLVARGNRLALVALAAFSLADLSLYALRHKPSENLQAFISGIETPSAVSDGWRIDPDYRPVWAYTGPPMKDFKVVHGYAALNPNNMLDYSNQISALRLAGVKWRKARIGATKELTEAAERGVKWVEISDPIPRARLLSKTQVSENPHQDVDKIDIAEVALVEKPLTLDGDPGAVALRPEVDRPGEIEWSVNSGGDQLFSLSERYHVGWRAEVDGKPVETLRVNGDFLGCLVGPGHHQIHFEFIPKTLRFGIWLSVAGVIMTLVFYVTLARFASKA